ncbi:CheY-P phosphatase CheX [Anatilimnocola aggregata]|uniref:CheY-P phosphatase CheX n=1 Tax=Anatilimnocola aggregata TaxID=2528021 RepID=A0A517Y667_9BACT|nr:chemotaxis protein CheX [Anatilimnocola aggregata]QDU25710.1 CheY-P phosphatase CheX [Anatilimnocola aggregata]
MRADYINPFISALVNTFETMLSCQLTRGPLYLRGHETQLHDVSGVIGLSGHAQGTVVLSLEKQVALQAAATLLLCETTELNDDVVDAVGELTNMVAGSAKAKLEEYQLSISLPSVILGAGHLVRFPSDVTPICVPFTCPWGALKIEVGLTDMRSSAANAGAAAMANAN